MQFTNRRAGLLVLATMLLGSVLPTCGADTAAMVPGGPDKAPPVAQWGRETLAQIETDLRVPGSDLYAEVLAVGGERGNKFGRFSFVWPAGFQLRALTAAAKADLSRYGPVLIRFADALEKYWLAKDGVGGYMVLTTPSGRFYDDNAWLMIGLIEAYEVTGHKRYLDRAKELIPLMLKAEKETPGGGIRQEEGKDKGKGAFTCTTAPAAVGALKLYRITRDKTYLEMAERWYAWLVSPEVGVRDPGDGLYHQGAEFVSGKWEVKRGYRAYQSALPLQAAVMLSQIKAGPDGAKYLAEAQRLAEACVGHWVKPSGAMSETGQWGGSDLVDALLGLYDLDHNDRWLAACCRLLRHLHDVCRDPNGRYGEDWNVDRRQTPLKEVHLLYMAPVARAYWRAARYR
jgi:uncharacterized protein YyaL (SSP411 family)